MSKRKQKRLESLRRRIHLLTLTIDNATSERARLQQQASLLTAKIQLDSMPEWKRDALMTAILCPASNAVPRKPVPSNK